MSVHRLLCTALVLAALLACRKQEKPAEWDEEPLEPGHFLIEIGGSSDRDIWVLSNNAVHQYDGVRWYEHDLSVRKLSVVAPDDAWFGGFMGTVVHYDGKKLENHPIEEAKKKYRDVSGIAAWPGEVWVAFSEPGYFRREGSAEWVRVEPPELRGWLIRGVWGKTKTDVWADIHNPGVAKVAHLQNGTWTIIDRPPGYGFVGSATNDVWFMGAGAMVHWDGTKLTDHPLPKTDARLYGLAASSPRDALVVGENGTAFRWDGASWNTLPKVGRYQLNRAFAPTGGRYRLIAGGSVFVRNTL